MPRKVGRGAVWSTGTGTRPGRRRCLASDDALRLRTRRKHRRHRAQLPGPGSASRIRGRVIAVQRRVVGHMDREDRRHTAIPPPWRVQPNRVAHCKLGASATLRMPEVSSVVHTEAPVDGTNGLCLQAPRVRCTASAKNNARAARHRGGCPAHEHGLRLAHTPQGVSRRHSSHPARPR